MRKNEKMKERLDEHIRYIRNEIQNAIGKQFNMPRYSESNMNITAIEKVQFNKENYRKEMEQLFI